MGRLSFSRQRLVLGVLLALLGGLAVVAYFVTHRRVFLLGVPLLLAAPALFYEWAVTRHDLDDRGPRS